MKANSVVWNPYDMHRVRSWIFRAVFQGSIVFPVAVCGQDPALPPGKNFDLSAWKLQTVEGTDHAFAQVTNPTVLSTYTSSFFFTDNVDGAMVFRVPSDGGTTSANAVYPRVELRQMLEGANWPLTDIRRHYLSAKCRVTAVAEVKPKLIVGQIHGSERNSELLKLRWTGYEPNACFVEARFQTNDPEGSEYGVTLAEGLSLGDEIDYTITMQSGLVTVTVNGNTATQQYTTEHYGTTDRYYFKAGNYIQWNDQIVSAPPIVYGEAKFYRVSLQEEDQVVTGLPARSAPYVHIYPNPTRRILRLSGSMLDDLSSLTITDQIGQSIKIQAYQSEDPNVYTLDLGGLAPGLYYLTIDDQLRIVTRKIMVVQ